MKTIDVTWAEFARGVLLLGRQGENLVSRLRVDVSEQLASHRGATFGLRVCTADGTVYPAAQVESSGGVVTWNITETDTARAGEGWAQLVMYGGGEEIAKTAIAHTLVLPSLEPGEEEPPDPVKDWINRAEGVLEELKQAGAGNVGAVRYDQLQNLTEAQKATARENIGAGTGSGEGGAGLPTVTPADEGKVLMVQGGEWAAAELPTYNGTYEVKPLANEETRLLTAQKFMTDNVTVKEIPYYETSNQSGSTVYIGMEVEIYGD